MRKRWKRKSGYVTPDLTISKKDLIKYDLFVNPFYDDWIDWRDGLRDWFSDFKKIKRINLGVTWYREDLFQKRIEMNLKQKRLLKIRRARKIMKKLRGSGYFSVVDSRSVTELKNQKFGRGTRQGFA